MRTRTIAHLGAPVFLLAALQACGSDDSGDGDPFGGATGAGTVQVCVLNDAAPDGVCGSAETLDFGVMAQGAEEMRRVRLEYTGRGEASITGAELSVGEAAFADAFTIAAARYTADPGGSGEPVRDEQPLATTISEGAPLHIEVTLDVPPVPGPLPESRLLVSAELGGEAMHDFEVPITGTINECDAGRAECDGDQETVCETDLQSDPANCGGCGTACSLADASANCLAAVCVVEACDPGFGNCDEDPANGCEIDVLTDAANCGGCNVSCAFTNAGAACVAGACEMQDCVVGAQDLDGNPANGCECVLAPGQDVPDDGFVDANCDGIDGDESSAVFVASNGSDQAPGTKAQPVRSIHVAITRAQSFGKSQILISEGTYDGRVTLANGISLYGGYSRSNGWARSVSYVATIQSGQVISGRVAAVEGENINYPTTIDRLRIRTTGISQTGISNYALRCQSCTALTLRNNIIEAGSAGPGGAGANGAAGAVGGAGGDGGPGSCSADQGGSGGSAGTSTCGASGGSGGKGGNKTENGDPGNPSPAGTLGGYAGSAGNPGNPGGPGDKGADGANGSHGSGGNGGNVSNGLWAGISGGPGGVGVHGKGGGGGGGGGGETWTLERGGGNGGGGGGAGGCRGTGGTGGGAGGGSFGAFLVSSTGVVLQNNTISSSTGGIGGSGGTGGVGGTGGGGGQGAEVCTVDVGAGGDGGDGGKGGNGGHGGGGPGGPSYAVYRSNTTANLAGNTLNHGNGGNGGASPGNHGAPGASGNSN